MNYIINLFIILNNHAAQIYTAVYGGYIEGVFYVFNIFAR